jgi:hypothetical protein
LTGDHTAFNGDYTCDGSDGTINFGDEVNAGVSFDLDDYTGTALAGLNAGTDINGTAASGTSWADGGTHGRALVFDGSANAYATLGDRSGFDVGTGEWAIEMWVYADSWTGTQQLFYKYDNPDGVGITTFNDTLMVLGCGSSLTSSLTLVAGEWNHIVVQKVVGATSILKCYINGTEDPTTGATATGTVDTTTNAYLGDQAGINKFTGKIGQFRFIQKALNHWEVQHCHYSRGYKSYTEDGKCYPRHSRLYRRDRGWYSRLTTAWRCLE